MVNQAQIRYDCSLNGCEASMTVYTDTNNDGQPENQETFQLRDGQNTTQLYKIDWNVGTRYYSEINLETDDVTKSPVIHEVEIERGITTDTRGIEIRTKAQLNDGSISLNIYEDSKTYDRIKKDSFDVPEGEVITYIYNYDVEPGNEFWVEPEIEVDSLTSKPPVLEYVRILPYPDIGFVRADITEASASTKFGFPSNLTTAANAITKDSEGNKITAVGNVTLQTATGRKVAIGEADILDRIAVPLGATAETARFAPGSLLDASAAPQTGILLALGDKPLGDISPLGARASGLGVACDIQSGDASGLEATVTNQTVRPVGITAKQADGSPLEGFPSALGRFVLGEKTSVVSTTTEGFPSGIASRPDLLPADAIPFRGDGDTSQTVEISPTVAESTALVGGIDIELDKKDVIAIPKTPTTIIQLGLESKQATGTGVQAIGTDVLYESIEGIKEIVDATPLTGGSQNITSGADITSANAGPFDGLLTSSVQADIYNATQATVTPLRVNKGKLTSVTGTGVEVVGGIGQTSDSIITEATAYTTITGKKTIVEASPLTTVIRAYADGEVTSANGDALPPVVGRVKDSTASPIIGEGRGVAATQALITQANVLLETGSKNIRTAVVDVTEADTDSIEGFQRTAFPTQANIVGFLTATTKFKAEITQAYGNTGLARSPSESSRVSANATPLTPDVETTTSAVGGESGISVTTSNVSTDEAFRFLSGKITEATSPNQFEANAPTIGVIANKQQASGTGVVPRNCVVDMAPLGDDDRTEVIASPIPPQGRDTVTDGDVSTFETGPSQVTVNTKGFHRVSNLSDDDPDTAPEYEGEPVKCKIYQGYDEDDNYYYYTDLVYAGTDESVMNPDIGCGPLQDGESGYLKEGPVGDSFGANPKTARMSAVTDVVDVKQASANPVDVEGEIGRVWGPKAFGTALDARGLSVKVPGNVSKQVATGSALEPGIDLSTADSVTEANVITGVGGTDLPWELEPPMQGAVAFPLTANPKKTAEKETAVANTLDCDVFTGAVSEGIQVTKSPSITRVNATPVDAAEFLYWDIEGIELRNVIEHEASHDYLKLTILCDKDKAKALRTLKRNAGSINKIIQSTGDFTSWSENNTRWVEVRPPYKLRPLRMEDRYLVENFDEKPLGANADSREIQLKLIRDKNKRGFPQSTRDYTSTPEAESWEFRFDKYNIVTNAVTTNLSKKGYGIKMDLILSNEEAWILETNLSRMDAVEKVDALGAKETIYDNNPDKKNTININTPDSAYTPFVNANGNYVATDWKTKNVTDKSYAVTLQVQEPTIPPIAYGSIKDVDASPQIPEVSRNVTSPVTVSTAGVSPKRSEKAKKSEAIASPIEVAPTIIGSGRTTSASVSILRPTVTPAEAETLTPETYIPAVTSIDNIKEANASTFEGSPSSRYDVTITDGVDTEEGRVLAVEDNLSAESYYNYSNGSASTFDIKRRTNNNTATVFLYLDTFHDEISLILIYGRPGDNKGGGSASMSFSGLPGDISIIVKDDPGDTYSINPPNGSVEHSWGGNGTDGVVLGTWDLVDNFSCTLSVDSFTDIDTIRVLGDNWDTVQMDMSTDITLTVDH